MNESATVTISIADAQTACHGMMTSQSLSAAQATQTVARIQRAIQAEVVTKKDEDTMKETDHA
jgi:protein-disulfide isomerase-like protein with CxxC motif